jgi:endo-1,4-beta-D-glucanase Y
MWILFNGEYWKNVSNEEMDRIILKNITEEVKPEVVKKVRKPRTKRVA